MSDTLRNALRDAYIKGAQDAHDTRTKLIDWQAEAEPIAAEYRNQIFQELIEKIGPKASVYSYSRYGCMELEWDYSVADWLKSQMEGGE